VIRSGRRSIVMIALGDGRFEPREVALGLDGGDGWVEVKTGLELGEEVVVSGQFLLDSESKLQEAVRKLLSAEEHRPAKEHGRSAGGERRSAKGREQ
jgi:multidrug efflux pump subunit AcrA (membrane-fusion protein)